MATTTNYGWTTPDDTALVKDGAAAIRTLGTSVDTTTKNLNPSTTLGDIEYRSSTANTNTRLGIGSTGNVLTVAGGVPTWAAPAGGGKVLQVVSATYATATTTTSTSFVTTNLAATITPTSATSKILVLTQSEVEKGRGTTTGDTDVMVSAIYRGGSAVWTGSSSLRVRIPVTTNSSPNVLIDTVQSLVYLDSPATTSATTYTVYFKIDSDGNATYHNGNSTSSIILMEVGA
jgi:hypothetical protein